jgi:hypothetical protein
MMAGGRQKSLERMVDRAWCQAIIFKTANNLEEEIWKGAIVFTNMFKLLLCVNG